MQLISLLMALLLVFHWLNPQVAALAATVSYTPGATATTGSIDAEIPVTKVGKLLIPDGMAIIKDTTIDVMGTPSGAASKQNLLSGVVVKVEVTATGKTGKLSGLAYFRQGPGLAAIDDPNAEELIDTTDGGVVAGHIVSINRDEVEIEERNGNRRRIAMANIKAFHTPRGFGFVIPVAATAAIGAGSFTATATKMTMSPTGGGKAVVAKQPPSQPGPSGGSFPWLKVILGALVVGGVATAITLPIVLTVGGGHNDNGQKNAQLANILFLQQAAQQSQEVPQVRAPSSP